MPAIARLFPDAKVIACVRELPWVIDRIERLVQRNVFSPSSVFNYSVGGTVYTRANGVASADGMVGGPRVRAERRASLLPPDLFNRFVNDAFWRDPKNVPEGLQVV